MICASCMFSRTSTVPILTSAFRLSCFLYYTDVGWGLYLTGIRGSHLVESRRSLCNGLLMIPTRHRADSRDNIDIRRLVGVIPNSYLDSQRAVTVYKASHLCRVRPTVRRLESASHSICLTASTRASAYVSEQTSPRAFPLPQKCVGQH